MNTLRIQRFSSQRSPGEFSRTESPTRQGGSPVYPDASVASRDHPAGITSAEMIVMVVQPHPVRGRVARWHSMPGDAGLLPADVSPFSRDIIFNSLVAYPMGAGRIRMAPGKQAGKDGGRPQLKNGVAIWLLPRYWWSCSSTVCRWAVPRMIVLKTGRAISAPDSPEAMGTTPFLSGTLVFPSLIGASFQRVPILPEGFDCPVTKGKHSDFLTNIGGADSHGKYAILLASFVSQKYDLKRRGGTREGSTDLNS